jgi:hypothetical protein
MLRQTKYLTSRYNEPDGWSLSAYERDGGYQQAKRALQNHVDLLRRTARPILEMPLPPGCEHGDFFAPWRVNPGLLVRRSRLISASVRKNIGSICVLSAFIPWEFHWTKPPALQTSRKSCTS